MLHPPSLLRRARGFRRATIPAMLTSGVVIGALAVGVNAGSAGAAAAPAGTFTIGADPVAVNQPSDPGMGAIVPTADAVQNGMFGAQVAWPIVPLHASVARTGSLVTWGTPISTASQAGVAYDVWNPAAGFGRTAHDDFASEHGYDSFCNAFTELPDGRLLMVGGTSTMSTMIFDPTSGEQQMGQNLSHQRWYSTSLRLTDGRILVLGGTNPSDVSASGVASTPEIGTGTGAWADLTGARSDFAFGVSGNRWWYPRAFNAPSGNVVGMSGDHVWSLSVDGEGSVQNLTTLPFNPGVSGSQVMYAPGRILVAGGGQTTNGDSKPATTAAAVIDLSKATPAVRSVGHMAYPRNWLNLTVLQNGEVFADGGTKIGNVGHGTGNADRQAEIWNPTTERWRTAATAERTRSYHSTALLMPSGAVFTGGGGIPGPETNFNAEMYYPASLFTTAANGTLQWASRPAIESIAGSGSYGGTLALTIADGRAIRAASLISLPSVTHGENTDQRRIPLDIVQTGGTVSATLPGSLNTMPPGDYELTVTDTKGVPSAAQIITVRAGQPGLVTVGAAAAQAPTGADSTSTAVALRTNTSIGLVPVSQATSRVIHAQSAVAVSRPAKRTTRAFRTASSWIVRAGIGSRAGYSFESVDRPGYYLAAPTTRTGTVTLVRRHSSAAFSRQATFSARIGGSNGDLFFTLSSDASRYLGFDGRRLDLRPLAGSGAARTAETFLIVKGLASKR